MTKNSCTPFVKSYSTPQTLLQCHFCDTAARVAWNMQACFLCFFVFKAAVRGRLVKFFLFQLWCLVRIAQKPFGAKKLYCLGVTVRCTHVKCCRLPLSSLLPDRLFILFALLNTQEYLVILNIFSWKILSYNSMRTTWDK